MNKMNFKVPRLILFLSLCLPSSLALRRDSETEALRCLDGCNDEDVGEYIECHKDCELQYREREEEEGPGIRELDPRWRRHRHRPGGRGGGGEWEPPEGRRGERAPAWGPGGEYDQCRRLCEPYKRRERERCWERCEEREGARARRRDREREREVVDNGGRRVRKNPPAGDGDDPSRSKKKYKQCERACEKQQAGGQQRQLCKLRCRQQREREEEGERSAGAGGDVNLLLGIIILYYM